MVSNYDKDNFLTYTLGDGREDESGDTSTVKVNGNGVEVQTTLNT